MTHPRMRTIRKTVEFLKQLDPETCITYSAISQVVKEGGIPCIHVGNRTLILLEDAYMYFYGVPLRDNEEKESAIS